MDGWNVRERIEHRPPTTPCAPSPTSSPWSPATRLSCGSTTQHR